MAAHSKILALRFDLHNANLLEQPQVIRDILYRDRAISRRDVIANTLNAALAVYQVQDLIKHDLARGPRVDSLDQLQVFRAASICNVVIVVDVHRAADFARGYSPVVHRDRARTRRLLWIVRPLFLWLLLWLQCEDHPLAFALL